MSKLKIGILIPGHSADAGDWALPIWRRMIAGLAQTHTVRVIALRYPHRRERYSLDGVDVTALGWAQARGSRRLRLWIDALLTLRRLHREQPFDLLHSLWADETGALAVWAGQMLGLPAVVSVLGGELVGFPALGYGLQRARTSRWIVGQALHADAVLSTCTYTDGLIARAGYAVPPERVHRVGLGVDVKHFTPGAGYDPRRLIHVGSLIPIKDQATILRALALLPTDVTLDVIGEGTERARLERIAHDLGVGARVHWIGHVPHLDLPDYYRRAALHLMATWTETGPLATLEAAACGVPTVGTAVGMLPDHPGLGVAVPVVDAEAMAAAIRNLLDDPARLAAARSAARLTAEALSLMHMIEQIETTYQQVTRRNVK